MLTLCLCISILGIAFFGALWLADSDRVRQRFSFLQSNPPTAKAAAIVTVLVAVVSAATLYSCTLGPGRPDSAKMRQMRHLGFAFFGTGPRSAGPAAIQLQGFQPSPPSGDSANEVAPVVLSQLGERGSIRISPLQTTGAISGWSVRCSVTQTPVRVDGLICNPIAGGWLRDEETYWFRLSPSVSAGFRFAVRSNGVQVSLLNGEKGWLPLPHRGSEAIPLTRQLALADLLEAQPVDGEGNEQLRAIVRRLAVPLTGQATEEGLTGLDLLRRVHIVRERRYSETSRVGLLIDHSLGREGRQVRRNRSPQPLTVVSTDLTVNTAGGSLLIGEDSKLHFRLPTAKAEASGDLPQHLRLEFVNARAYPLPPASSKPVDYLISTVGSDLPLDGYYFATGNSDHPVYAKLRIAPEHRSVELLDSVKKDEKGVYRGRSMDVGEPFVLHDRMLGVVAEVRDSAADLRVPAWVPILILLASGLWMALMIQRNFRTISALEFALGALWIGAVALIVVRLVISFRTACIPPLDARAADLNRFRDTWLFSNLATVIPAVMTLATLLSFRRGSEGRITTGSFYGAREAERKQAGLRQIVDKMATVAMANIRDNCLFAMGWLAAACLTLAAVQTVVSRFDFTSVHSRELGFLVAGLICLYHLFYVGRGESWPARFKGLARYWLPLTLCAALFVAGMLLGQIASVRTSIAAFVVVIVCLLGLALRLAETEKVRSQPADSESSQPPTTPVQERKSLLGLFTISLAVVLVSVFLIDMGSFLYSIPLLFGLGLVWKPATGTSRPFIVATSLLFAFFLIVAWLFPPQSFAGRGIAGGDRWAVQMGRATEAMKATSKADSSSTADSVIRIEQQRWQMLAYAGAMGTSRPPGYGGTHLTEGGMQYRTMLSDAVFSVFVLGEHGVLVGSLICILYVLMFVGCLAAGWQIGRDRRWIFVAVVAIGGFYFTHGLYMALANLWSVPFTGQNMPLLSIASFWDVVQSAVLLPLACYLLYANLGPSWAVAGDFSGKFSRLGFLGLPIGFVVAVFGYFAIQARAIAAGDLTSYRISPAVIEHLQSQIDVGYLTVDRDLAIHADIKERPMSAIEWLAVDQFRKGRNESEKDLLYAAVGRDPEHPELRVNPNAFSLVSPLYSYEGVAWRGPIEPVAGERLPRMVHLSRPKVMVFDSSQRPRFVDVGNDRPGITRGRGIQPKTSEAARLAPFHRRLDGKIVVSAGLKNPGYAVYHNGIQLGVQKGSEQPLSANDVIVVENTKSQVRYHFLYLGPSAGSLAEVRWQNGAYRRIFEPGSSFVLARSLGALGDSAVQALIEKGARPAEIDKARRRPLHLSLDWSLHQQTQADLAKFCRQTGIYQASNPRSAEAAVTLMDSFSGEVLAMPSAPQAAPDELPEELAGVTTIKRQVVSTSNWNLRNHIIGSTVKPLTFAALANGLYKAPIGGGLDLAGIKVLERDSSHASFGDFKITTKIEKGGKVVEVPLVCGPPGNHAMDDYLTHSYTWVAVVTGSLGLIQDKANIGQIVKRTGSNPDFTYKGAGYRIDLDDDPTYFGPGSSRGEVMANVYTSVLFQSLHKLYGAVLESEEQGRWSAKNRTDLMKTFIPSFASAANSYAASYSMPAPILFDGAEFRDFRDDLISFMIGGGNNQWNNVQLASAFSSLATGQRVVPTLEARDPKATKAGAFDASFAPLNDLAWREANLYKPMEKSRLEGTARRMTTPLAGYRALFKTGTIGAAGGKTEDETLVFVVGKYVPGTGFVKGQTVTGYLYLSQSKVTTRRNTGVRFQLANPIIKRVVEYLKKKAP